MQYVHSAQGRCLHGCTIVFMSRSQPCYLVSCRYAALAGTRGVLYCVMYAALAGTRGGVILRCTDWHKGKCYVVL